MIVASALFAVVMLVSTTTLLSLVSANRKAQSLQSVMNNLNVALDGMVRAMRMGSEYNCGGDAEPDCATLPDERFSFLTFEGKRWIYWLEVENGIGRIYKSESVDADPDDNNRIAITAPTIDIDSLQFYVVGTDQGEEDAERIQPKVVIAIKGIAGADKIKTRTEFSMQATAVQRVLDI